MRHPISLGFLPLLLSTPTYSALIVVDDMGGSSALPYYQVLNVQPEGHPDNPPIVPPVSEAPYSEADMLPVLSTHLRPGKVERRVINLPGLVPLFLIGDDNLSRRWLVTRIDELRELNAMGLVVNVRHMDALTELRQLGSGLTMTPATADDLALRLAIQHYPVLITATGIEQ